jgi:hypothetical protein
VLAAAVRGDGIGPGRRGDDHIGGRVVDPAEAGILPQPGAEGVVAAGVEDHEAQPPRLPELAQEQVERRRLVGQVALAQ